jgi:Tol biopolymer transport system component
LSSTPRRLVSSLAACGLALAAVVPAAEASFPGRNGKLAHAPVFPMPEDSIGTITPDGEQAVLSTHGVAGPANIAFSPDGRRVAFDGPATTGSGRALYVMAVDGTKPVQVGRGDRRRYNPAFSPDGTKLVFVQDNGPTAGSGDIYTITTGGAGLTRVTTSSGWDGAPDWSPDGSRIAYVCRPGGRPQVCQASPTGASRSVTTGALGLNTIADPSWSPDGAHLAFSGAPAGQSGQVYRIPRSGGVAQRLTTVEGQQPAWSPDGGWIAYEQYLGDGAFGIATLNAADGTGAAVLTATETSWDIDPSGWQALPRG